MSPAAAAARAAARPIGRRHATRRQPRYCVPRIACDRRRSRASSESPAATAPDRSWADRPGVDLAPPGRLRRSAATRPLRRASPGATAAVRAGTSVAAGGAGVAAAGVAAVLLADHGELWQPATAAQTTPTASKQEFRCMRISPQMRGRMLTIPFPASKGEKRPRKCDNVENGVPRAKAIRRNVAEGYSQIARHLR